MRQSIGATVKDALEVLRNRRSIRKFTDKQVSEELLAKVLEAGLYAPTGAGTQTPVIIVIQDPETVIELDKLNARVLNMDQMPHPYYGAPTILVVIAPSDSPTFEEDCSLVAGNILNASYAVGLGSCWIHRAKEVFASPEGKALLRRWNLPESMVGVASIALGYPDCPHPDAAPRKDKRVVRI